MNRAAAALLLQMLTTLHVDAAIAIADDAHDNLFIVVPRKDGRPLLLRLRY